MDVILKKSYQFTFRSALILLTTLSMANNGFAQTTIPASATAGRVAQQVAAEAPTPKKRPVSFTSPTPQQAAFPKEVAAIQLKLNNIILDGNTRYTNKQLMALFPFKMGSTVTLGDIQHFANAITLRYNKNGYLLSQAVIPAQTIQNGVIHIKIIEGYIANVKVEGPISEKNKALIQRYGNKVLNKIPLNIKELETALLLASDLPGMDVKSIITPSKNVVNAADLTLVVQHEVVDNTSYIDYDNRGTRYIGPERVIASYYWNSLLGDGAATGVRLAESGHWNQMRYMELEHKQYVGINGLMFDIDAQYTRTYPGFLLQGTNTLGTNKYALLGVQYPLIRLRSHTLYVNANFTYVNSFQEQFLTKIYNDQIRTLQFGLNYNSLDSYFGSNQLTGSITRGLNIMGASQPGNLVSRVGAKPVFTKFNLSGGRLQGLPRSFSILLTGNGQYTPNKMYAYEQIGYGGLPFGNAYDPSEIIADRGIEAKLEIRRDTSFPFQSIPTQYFIYYDGGVLWNIDHINQPGRQSGTSAGFGLRSTAYQHISINLELDKPLTRKVAAIAAEPNGGNPKQWRGFFSIVISA